MSRLFLLVCSMLSLYLITFNAVYRLSCARESIKCDSRKRLETTVCGFFPSMLLFNMDSRMVSVFASPLSLKSPSTSSKLSSLPTWSAAYHGWKDGVIVNSAMLRSRGSSLLPFAFPFRLLSL
ncbi:hypothetical protein EDD18DRAFT_634344 [Armillaria luteobubalina]|uniref:Secreted protein n=1 Tax=Armillaria luteobubalina TaxID=153913 RepID=A0AA39QJG1_9AGAR|nr:hypothetical protein EDD18DRAFT_634344 [Armillaria luteobubalina]